MAERDDDLYDIAVVGYGPVGMTAAALLGRLGHRVVVLERYDGMYNLPRAGVFDDETMRTFAMLGVAQRMLPTMYAARGYEWMNASGELLMNYRFAERGTSGWAEWYGMYQPYLEDALDAACRKYPGVELRFGSRVTRLEQSADRVELGVDGQESPVRARFVLACDGGNSFVRQELDIPLEDHGFSEPWLVCDFRLKRPVNVPAARQMCDPAQPTSIISLGPAHHRISFMLDSEQTFATEQRPERVWARVAPYLDRNDADLIRAATYTFRSLVAHDWRVGRVLLAGDAAHQMPPFLGQGMGSGVRDVLNLSFKLDLVLRGIRSGDLLDTYQSERDPHVRAVIALGIELGRLQTIRDPEAAAERDATLLAARDQQSAPKRIAFPPLGPGMFGAGDGARERFVQGFVTSGGRSGRFDEILGYGWTVLLRAGLLPDLDPAVLEAARAQGVRLVAVSPPSGDGTAQGTRHAPAAGADTPAVTPALDVDGTYTAWLDAHHSDTVAVRPDFHVWGTARGAAATEHALHTLAAVFTEPSATPDSLEEVMS